MIDRKKRIQDLRSKMKEQNLDGFIVPLSDRYQNEYPDESARRLEWLTGFTGSAGVSVVLADKAVFITNSIYSLQVKIQLDQNIYSTENIMDISLASWISHNAQYDCIIGYDPWLHTSGEIDKIKEECESKNIKLLPVTENIIDKIWVDRPKEPATEVEIFPEEIAGTPSIHKRKYIEAELKDKSCYAAIITLSDSIAWILNIRASDCPDVPVACSYAVIYEADGSVDWFICPSRITEEVKKHLGEDVRIIPPSSIQKHMEELASKSSKAGKTILLDSKTSPEWFRVKLQNAGAGTLNVTDPSISPKSIKTSQEQNAMRVSHIRDGAAVTKFLYWIDKNQKSGITEMDIDEKLIELRSHYPEFRGTSFNTIAGAGSNGAIVHYRSTPDTNRELVQDSLVLVDSGAQYTDGTTDITRTIAIGTPSEEMKRSYTIVLKGHINLAMSHYPEGTTGIQLDTYARQPLWDNDMDYAHGTGHGVGCHLAVHEAAAGISPRSNNVVKAGMIHSNEPGYYVEGEYGIRIESLMICNETKTTNSAGKIMLENETITMAPLDVNLIITELLTDKEKQWLNSYHQTIFDKISGLLNEDEVEWLRNVCRVRTC